MAPLREPVKSSQLYRSLHLCWLKCVPYEYTDFDLNGVGHYSWDAFEEKKARKKPETYWEGWECFDQMPITPAVPAEHVR